jgi:glycosyltransferase involved in cell wall biosynthesis
MTKNKILYILKLPPPITGATLMNQRVLKSQLLTSRFNTHHIGISYNANHTNLGKPSIRKIRVLVFTVLKLVKDLIAFRPDLTYFQISPVGIPFFRDLIIILILKIFRNNILLHIQGLGIDEKSRENRFVKMVYQFAFNNTGLICFTEFVTGDIQPVYNGTPFTVANGIEDVFRANSCEKKEGLHGPPVILFLSNLMVDKGIFDFTDCLSILKGRGIDFQARIVGDSCDVSVAELKEHIREKGLQNAVSIIGPLFDNRKFLELANADLFVFPTRKEGFGNVALEAMQCKLPIVASHEGSLPLIVQDGVTGFLFPKEDSGAMADKITWLLEDAALRKKLGEAGRDRFLEMFTLDIFEKNMSDVFEKALTN